MENGEIENFESLVATSEMLLHAIHLLRCLGRWMAQVSHDRPCASVTCWLRPPSSENPCIGPFTGDQPQAPCKHNVL